MNIIMDKPSWERTRMPSSGDEDDDNEEEMLDVVSTQFET
jgi:hypothetical protein